MIKFSRRLHSQLCLTLLVALLPLGIPSARASQSDFESKITIEEFEALLVEKAPLVDVFNEIWIRDKDASIVFGAVRNYAFWMKRKITETSVDEVRKLTRIKSAEFLPRGSDLDVLLSRPRPGPKGKPNKRPVWAKITRMFRHISHIESVRPGRFEPDHRDYLTDVSQGWIPAEKLRLAREGFIRDATFGSGLEEIYTGRVSIFFSSDADFATNHYVLKQLNHRVLLVARFIRNVTMSYAALAGKDNHSKLDSDLLLSLIPKDVQIRIHTIVKPLLTTDELAPYLAQTGFVRWLNHSLERAYFGPVHVEATRYLHQHFGFADLVKVSPELSALPTDEDLNAPPLDCSKLLGQ